MTFAIRLYHTVLNAKSSVDENPDKGPEARKRAERRDNHVNLCLLTLDLVALIALIAVGSLALKGRIHHISTKAGTGFLIGAVGIIAIEISPFACAFCMGRCCIDREK